MPGPTFGEMLRAIVQALVQTWRPCQPLLVMAAVIALAVSAVFGLLAPGDVGESLAGLPLTALTLAVSAGIAGYIVTGDGAFTTLHGVVRDPRSYRFVLRYLLLSIGLSLPLLAMVPVLGGAAQGDVVGGGALLVALALVLVVIFLAARLALFPYTSFLPRPLALNESWQATEGYALRIVGCILLFAVGILAVVTLVTFTLGGILRGLGEMTGGGGQAATMALQALGQLAAVYAIDCVYGTLTRMLTGSRPQPLPSEPDES